jgi:site-specific DNA recombinase
VIKQGPEACTVRRVPTAEIEAAVIDCVRALVRTPEIVVGAWKAARRQDAGVTEEEVRNALAEFDAIWDELFPAEQARIVQLLVERVEVKPDGLTIQLRTEGLASLAADLRQKAAA